MCRKKPKEKACRSILAPPFLRHFTLIFSDEYDDLRSKWQAKAGSERVKNISNMVWKDVLRTDRYAEILITRVDVLFISLACFLINYSLNKSSFLHIFYND